MKRLLVVKKINLSFQYSIKNSIIQQKLSINVCKILRGTNILGSEIVEGERTPTTRFLLCCIFFWEDVADSQKHTNFHKGNSKSVIYGSVACYNCKRITLYADLKVAWDDVVLLKCACDVVLVYIHSHINRNNSTGDVAAAPQATF